jgi:MFS family permease
MTVVTALRMEPRLAALVAVVAVQFVAIGALDVLLVVLALKVLALGPSGAGYLTAAFGAGGIVGGTIALTLVGRHRLVGPMLGGVTGWGAAFLVLGAWPTVAGAFALLIGAGAGRTVLDVSGRTILHRVVPAQIHGRVFGVLEGLAMLGLAVGSISVPAMVDVGGAQAALAAVGGLLVVVALTSAGTLRGLERATPAPDVELGLLRGSPLFSMLAAPVLEGLARALVPRAVPGDEVVVREGDRGDRFYLVAAGTLAVSTGGIQVGTLAPGDGFGEIALLRDGLRTATVTACGPATLYALERAPFLEAMTGSHHARRAAEELVAQRLRSAAR